MGRVGHVWLGPPDKVGVSGSRAMSQGKRLRRQGLRPEARAATRRCLGGHGKTGTGTGVLSFGDWVWHLWL
jgi:hypothetical protein